MGHRILLAGLIGMSLLCDRPGLRAQGLSAEQASIEPPPQEWKVVGQVKSLKSEPIAGVTVQLDFDHGPGRLKTVETNLKGNFEANISVGAGSEPQRQISIRAVKDGYFDACETVGLESSRNTQPTELVLRESPEDIHQLPLGKLISSVAPSLRVPTRVGSTEGHLAEREGGNTAAWLQRDYAGSAVGNLLQLVQHEPRCVQCRTLWGLALLARGSWVSANRELTQAAVLNVSEKGEGRSAAPLLILGVLETWRGNLKKAAVFLLQALEVEPSYPLALQELGRVFVLEKRGSVADRLLKRAIQVGASADARFLRAQALLDEGVPEEAQAEMQAYLNGRKPKQLPRPVRMEWLQMTSRLQIESREKTTSFVDMPLGKLLEEVPDLQGLRPATSAGELAPLLHKVGERVRAFFTNFPNTSSFEEITLSRLGGDGKIKEFLRRDFRYLLLPETAPSGFGLREHRTSERGLANGLAGVEQFMVTEGFASQSLHFHPDFQDGSRFRYVGRQSLGGHEADVVAFAQRPETARVLEDFRLKDSNTVVLVQGVAWIDANTHQIIRMRTDLLKPAPEIRLRRQTTDIRFHEVRFARVGARLWLPREVSVTVAWSGRILRNLHRYSDFQLFNVEARERFKAPKTPELEDDPQ